MPEFNRVDHASLSVTDLDRSERFYVDVLGFMRLFDFGYVKILIHRPTSFFLAIIHHEAARDGEFSELNTGLDHLGLGVSSREELIEWEHRFDEHGVTYTPTRDMEFGYHLNFRDPDNIALELSVNNEVVAGWIAELKQREIPREEIEARVGEYLATLGARPGQ